MEIIYSILAFELDSTGSVLCKQYELYVFDSLCCSIFIGYNVWVVFARERGRECVYGNHWDTSVPASSLNWLLARSLSHGSGGFREAN